MAQVVSNNSNPSIRCFILISILSIFNDSLHGRSTLHTISKHEMVSRKTLKILRKNQSASITC